MLICHSHTPLVKRPFISFVHFLIKLFVFLLSLESSSCILGTNPLSDMQFATVFPNSVGSLLIVLTGLSQSRSSAF